MQITDVKTYIAGNGWKNWVFVQVETDEGIHGIGEATLNAFGKTVEAAVHELKPYVIGKDPFDVEKHSLSMFRDVFSDGGQIQGAALSGIEFACWDIMGKVLGQPVYKLLGGKCHDQLRVYANGWYTSGERTPENFYQMAKKVVEKGYTALKFDPFGSAWKAVDRQDFSLAIELIAAVRDAVGKDVDVLIEGHNRFSVHTALRFAEEMAPYEPTWFEAPVPPQSVSSMIEVAKRSPVPIACGEDYYCKEQFAELLAHNQVHIIQLEPQFMGLTAAKQVAGMVNAFNGVIAPHSAQGPLCSIVCAHLNTATPNFFIHEIFDDFNEPWTKNVLTNTLEVKDGYITLSDRPGWGTDLNLDEIEKHPYQRENFLPLFRDGWEKREPVKNFM
ncbi:mandelate racemase/muconate lactonizing enzyme family protein [Gracilibacillus salitolerans]|uniref:Mandelate racemase/muconate lactonizing enzyme family protein n=1 Tax=Gracilibacillus salitolerans TaxID=2663022 RepID=A0A5Q2TV32_9BACI|nr:mandelate racemase/muconate lactonizing enzyme family protein [Gracilibacillus salitolerans]QGH36668.1 mandelate racemase/muconate lactonizing enzyme family protein [Gracilibacillus salitolerans]